MKIYEDPIIHFYLPSLLMWVILSTHQLHLSRLLSERSCGPKRHSIASPPGWYGGEEGWSKPVHGWLDDWKPSRYKWLSFTPGCTRTCREDEDDNFEANWPSLGSMVMAVIEMPAKYAASLEILGNFDTKTYHFPGLHKSSRNSICCTESIVWQVSAMSVAATEGKKQTFLSRKMD